MSAAAIEALPQTIDAAEWPELSYRLGLTDGLPTFPPDRDQVDRLVAASGLAADHRIGTIPPAGRLATVEAIAANAVMAGCLPEHFAIVLTALRSMLEPRFNLGGIVTTTHPCWPLVIVSGRAVTELGMATRESVFNGGGARANLAIGRAIRLVTWNLGGAYPRQPVQEIMGHPGRMAYCIAEEPVLTPWMSLGHFRGADTGAGSVTVFACEGPQICNPWGIATRDGAKVGERWLDLVADQMSGRGNSNTHTMGEILVVFNPAMARTLAREGFDRPRIQAYLFETARRRLGDIRVEPDGRPSVSQDAYYEWWPDWVDQGDPDAMIPVVWSPESIHIVVAGGDSIPCATICPSWGHLGGFAITKPL